MGIIMEKILITGGAGFIGTNLTEHFLGKGYEVEVFDNLFRRTSIKNMERIKKEFPEVKITRGDICSYDDVMASVKGKNIIIHTAAQVAVTTSMEDPVLDKRINVDGTLNVLEAARKQDKKPAVIYFSTNKVYGNNVNNVPVEEHETRFDFSGKLKGKGIPETFSIDAGEHTPYGVSKLCADLYARDYFANFGVPSAVNRCSCMIGENQYGNEDQGWVAHFVLSALNGKTITIYGNGKQVRDVLYVSDVARLVDKEIENIHDISGEAFNIGGGPGNTVSIIELLENLKRHQALPDIKYSNWRPADQKVFYSDISKAEKMLGWKPEVSAEEGINRLYKWAKRECNLKILKAFLYS